MHPGKYFFLVIIFTLILLGGACFAAFATDILISAMNGENSELEMWTIWALAIGLASLTTTAIDVIRSDS